MKTLAQITANLLNFEKQYGLKLVGAQQQSIAWFQGKLGVLSSSNASKIVAKRDSETRHTYMCELVAQICTGEWKDITAAALDWGNQHEDAARAYYEFSTGLKLTPLPFVFRDASFREGCSPDAFVTDRRGCEIKCPFASANYIKFLVAESVKPEWKWQQQFTMRVTEAEEWDFREYDPRMHIKPMHGVTTERNEIMQKTLADAVPQFIHDMDKMLESIGIKFGEQWTRLAHQSEEASSATI